MGYNEERAIREVPNPPDIWLRYVDAHSCAIRKRHRTVHIQHLNSIEREHQVHMRTRTEWYISLSGHMHLS